MSERPLRLGLVGSGFAARTLVAAARRLPDARVVAVHGGRGAPELARSAGAEHVGRLDTLIDAVDAVLVASPHALHAEHASEAVRRGRSVFVEKPFVTEVGDGERLLEEAERASVAVSVNHFQRYRTPNAAARAALRDGRIGAVVGASCTLLEQPMTRPWQTDVRNAGFLLGYGVHAVDLVHFWLDEPVVSVRGRHAVDDGGTERSTVATLELAGGAQVQLLTSDRTQEQPGDQVGRATLRSVVVGDRGLCVVDSYGQAALHADGLHTLGELGRWSDPDDPERMGAYVLALAQFVRASRTGTPPELTGADALRAVAVCTAIARSAASGGAPVCV